MWQKRQVAASWLPDGKEHRRVCGLLYSRQATNIHNNPSLVLPPHPLCCDVSCASLPLAAGNMAAAARMDTRPLRRCPSQRTRTGVRLGELGSGTSLRVFAV